MVINKLIEPELKPVPPRGDIFVLYCSHCLQKNGSIRLSSACISGGRRPSLSPSLTWHIVNYYIDRSVLLENTPLVKFI